MDYGLLGKILASIATGAAVAGAIETDAVGIARNPEEIAQIISGFLSIWLQHPASGAVPPSLASVSVLVPSTAGKIGP